MALFSNLNVRRVGLLLSLFAIGAICYLAAIFDTFPGDMDALKAFQGLRSSGLDAAARISTFIGNTLVVVISVPLLALAMWFARKRADAIAILALLIPDAMNQGLKVLVDRPRPDFAILISSPESPSFPSGHALHAILLLGLLIFIVGDLVKPARLRLGVQGLLALLILAVGASRVYLGVHWPSDVLGGYLVGGFSLAAIMWVRKVLISRGLQ